MLVAVVNGLSHRRATLAHRGAGRVVVYDRFVLDSVVRLRFLYGRDERFRAQRRVLRALSPPPLTAFWLDVPAERSFARKAEHWNVDDLSAQRALYGEEHEALDVRRIDGEHSPDAIAAEIAADVWRRL
jgi:thymidylate kinase